MYPFRDIFTLIKKGYFFYTSSRPVAIVESEMFLHAGQAKKLLRGQIIIAKVTLERAPCFIITLLYFLSLYSDDSFFPNSELQKVKINPQQSITRLWETADNVI